MTEMILKEFAGQRKDVSLHVRDDGSRYVTFHAPEHYGYPSLELDQLKRLVKLLEEMPR